MDKETEVEVAEEPVDEFAEAFAEAVAEPEAEEPEAEKPVAEEPEAEESVAEEPVAEEPAEESSQGDMFAQELAKLREELAPAREPEQAVEESPPPPVLSTDETSFLKQYEEDWPDISRAEALKRKTEMDNLARYVFAEVSKAYAPIVDYYKNSAYNEHDGAIHGAHGDYDAVREDVIKWATGQTSPVRRKVFSEIVQSGTADEIIDLVDAWKEATGKKKSADGVVHSSATETPAKAKQAAQKLSVVSSKRTSMPTVADPADYDAAFAEFSKAG